MPSNTVTFNVAQYLPDVVTARVPAGTVPLAWTFHALTEADRDGFDFAPDEQDMAQVEVVEVTTDARLNPLKLVVRRRHDPSRDMVLVLARPARQGGAWTVVTAWANRTGDRHRTLRTDHLAMAPVRL